MTRALIAPIVIVALSVLSWQQWQLSRERSVSLSARDERDAWQDSTRQITATAKAAMGELVSERVMRDRAGADLVTALRRLNAKPETIIKTVIIMRTDTLRTTLRDTIIAGVPQWLFRERVGRYVASGSVYPQTKGLMLSIAADPLELSVIVSRTKLGNIIGVVDSPDTTLKITLDVSTLQPAPPSRWAKVWRGVKTVGLVAAGFGIGKAVN